MIFEEMIGLALIAMCSLAFAISVWPVKRPAFKR